MAQPAKNLITEVITKLQSSVKRLDHSRIDVAYDLHWAKGVINWKDTDYGSWTLFCSKELNLNSSMVSRYITTINLLERFNYSKEEFKQMVDAIGWTRTILCLALLKRKISSKRFILKYREWSTANSIPTPPDPGGDRAYAYSLPADIADKLDSYLEHYGMSTYGKNRKGIREAMIRLIEIQLP